MQHTIWPQHVLLFSTSTSGQVTGTCDHKQKGRGVRALSIQEAEVRRLWHCSVEFSRTNWRLLATVYCNLGGTFSVSHICSRLHHNHRLCDCSVSQHSRIDCSVTAKNILNWAQYVNSSTRWCHSVALSQLNHFLGLCVFLFPVWLTSGADLGHRMQ